MKTVLYIHGKGGSAAEAEFYKELFPTARVLGMDYTSDTPWQAMEEFPALYDALTQGSDEVTLIANSIGTYFAMLSLGDKAITTAYFISPVVDMEKLIRKMMIWAGVSEERLEREKEIVTPFGETLSWDYLCFAKDHPSVWSVPTHILYAGGDNLTDRSTVTAFADKIGATLTVMEAGEHWFHTPEQMEFLKRWMTSLLNHPVTKEMLL